MPKIFPYIVLILFQEKNQLQKSTIRTLYCEIILVVNQLEIAEIEGHCLLNIVTEHCLHYPLIYNFHVRRKTPSHLGSDS